MRMKNIAQWLCICALLSGAAMAAAEEGEQEKKPKKEEKPRPDSAVSMVMHLPEVKKWQNWVDSKKDGSSLEVWGEAVKTLDGGECWDVAVGVTKADDTKVLARFCIMQKGLDMYVEGKQKNPLDEIIYIPYEKWRSMCRPTASSAGDC